MPMRYAEYQDAKLVVERKLLGIETELQEENTIWQLSRLLAQQGLCKTLLRELQSPTSTHKDST